jgi:hypothetical protein
MKKLLFASFIFINAVFVLTAQNTTVTTFNNVHQRFGNGNDTRTVVDSFLLPAVLDGYKQIIMHYTLSCPTGGCDPWDRFATISLKRGNETLELGRYMTPYKKGCGADYDVTDYSTLLTGKVVLTSFIDTWVDPGWLVKITFEYVKGTPAIPATKVENVWQNYGLIYGDPTKPASFSPVSPAIAGNAKSVKLKIVLTGHGQGNTDNAAEFSQYTHSVYVNDVSTFSHYLWRTDCASNTCSAQSGTWTYNRAGWCPGASVIPVYYDLTSKITPGKTVKLEYRLKTYNNACRPTNTGCVTGSTCTDCNYNYNGHTEPYYAMSAQLISVLDKTTDIATGNEVGNLEFSIFPNPVSGRFELAFPPAGSSSAVVSIYNITGEKVLEDQKIMIGSEQKIAFDTGNLKSGIYFLKVDDGKSAGIKRLVVLP